VSVKRPQGSWTFDGPARLSYPLSYEHVTDLAAERGVEGGCHLHLAPGAGLCTRLNKRCPPHLKPTNKSYRIDETLKARTTYLYRTLDSTGQTIDFLLTAKRDTAEAKPFLRRAIDSSGNPMFW
jgi:transposase-like protein